MDISTIIELTNGLSSISKEMLQMYIAKIVSIAAVPIFILALINCFFGYKIFRIVVTIGGTLLGGLIGVMVGAKLDSSAWLLAAVVICAAAGAFAAYKLYMAGAFVMGFFTGMLVGAVAMVVLQKDAVLVAAVLAGLVLGLLAVDLYKYVLVALTSINGGILIGVSVCAILEKNNPKLVLLIGAIFSLLGMIVQYIYVFTHDDEATKDKKKKQLRREKKISRKVSINADEYEWDEDIEELTIQSGLTKNIKKTQMQREKSTNNRVREKAYYEDDINESNNYFIPEILFDNATNLMFVYVIISVLCDMANSQNVLGQTLVTYPIILFATAMINILKKDYKMAVAGFSMFEIATVIYFLGIMGNTGLINVVVILAEVVCVGLIIIYIFKRYITVEESIEPSYDFGYEDVEAEEGDTSDTIRQTFNSKKATSLIKELDDITSRRSYLDEQNIDTLNVTRAEKSQEQRLKEDEKLENEFDISDMIMQQTQKAMKDDEFSKV